jgi:hypothetical protein
MKRWYYMIGAAVFCWGLGFVIGKYLSTPRVIEKTVEDVQATAKIHQLLAENELLRRQTVKETVTVFAPTGKPKTKTVKEHTQIDKSIHATADVQTDKIKHVRVERTISPLMSNWRIGAKVGFDFTRGAPVYGGEVQRRILGPLSVGVWGLTPGVVGASLNLEF